MRPNSENKIPWNFRLTYKLERNHFRPAPLVDVALANQSPMIHTWRLSKYSWHHLLTFLSRFVIFETSALLPKGVDENGFRHLKDPVYLIVRRSGGPNFDYSYDVCNHILTNVAQYLSFKFQQHSWTRQLIEWSITAERASQLSGVDFREGELDLGFKEDTSSLVNWKREGF